MIVRLYLSLWIMDLYFHHPQSEEDRKKTEGRQDETFSSLVLVLTLQSQGYKYKQFFYQQHPNRK
jgi:hypothetical protein